MQLHKRLSKEYWKALPVALVFQVVFVLLAGMMLDGGQCAQWCAVSTAAWWGGLLMVVVRRPMAPTKTDLFLIRWGFPHVWGMIRMRGAHVKAASSSHYGVRTVREEQRVRSPRCTLETLPEYSRRYEPADLS